MAGASARYRIGERRRITLTISTPPIAIAPPTRLNAVGTSPSYSHPISVAVGAMQ